MIYAALPALPGLSCPSAASALGVAGLGTVCRVATGALGVVGSAGSSGVTGLAGSAASQVAGFGVDTVLNDLGGWVADGAGWLLGQIGTVISNSTDIDLGASWFGAHYATMAALAGVVVVPMMLLGIIQSIYRQNASTLLRSVLVNVPLALLLTAVAVKLVQLGLAVTDAMSAAVAHGAGLDAGHFMGSVTAGLSGNGATAASGAPAFVLFLGALAVVFGAVLLWVELLVRAAAVYVAVLFLPLALASLAWPAIAHWCRRLVDTLVALVLGKFVIVSVLSLAAGALAGGTGSTPAGGSGPSTNGGFTAVLGGAALLLLSAFAPWSLFRLLPFLEAGAVGHLEGFGRQTRQSVAGPVRGLANEALRTASSAALAGKAAGMMAGAVGGTVGGAATGALESASASRGISGQGSAGGGPGGSSVPGVSGVMGVSGSVDGLSSVGDDLGGPDTGASSEIKRAGDMGSPGHGIPMWAVHADATTEFRRRLTEGIDEEAPKAGVEAPASAVRPLPRASGALRDHVLGRDELGPRLIALPPPSESPASHSGSGRGTDG